jgi:hypothetical protein
MNINATGERRGHWGHSPAGAHRHRHRHHCGIIGIIFSQKWRALFSLLPAKNAHPPLLLSLNMSLLLLVDHGEKEGKGSGPISGQRQESSK